MASSLGEFRVWGWGLSGVQNFVGTHVWGLSKTDDRKDLRGAWALRGGHGALGFQECLC